MDARTQQTMSNIMARVSTWIKSLAEQLATISTPEAIVQLEQCVRVEGQPVLGSMVEILAPNARDHQPEQLDYPALGHTPLRQRVFPHIRAITTARC